MITEQLSLIAFYLARMILTVLGCVSVLTVAFFIERLIYFRLNFNKNSRKLLKALDNQNSLEDIKKILSKEKTAETEVVLHGLIENMTSSSAFEKRVRAHLTLEKEKWERYSLFLGSVGSNAPFVGLLGTVLGIMKSFADLSAASRAGANVVMSGISEALILTAVGLGVAIPAVIFYNICKSRVKKAISRVEAMVELIGSKPIFIMNQNKNDADK